MVGAQEVQRPNEQHAKTDILPCAATESVAAQEERWSRRDWTPAERRILEIVAANRGWDFAEANAHLALIQAEMIGEL